MVRRGSGQEEISQKGENFLEIFCERGLSKAFVRNDSDHPVMVRKAGNGGFQGMRNAGAVKNGGGEVIYGCYRCRCE
jgi:hypothetical protein